MPEKYKWETEQYKLNNKKSDLKTCNYCGDVGKEDSFTYDNGVYYCKRCMPPMKKDVNNNDNDSQ